MFSSKKETKSPNKLQQMLKQSLMKNVYSRLFEQQNVFEMQVEIVNTKEESEMYKTIQKSVTKCSMNLKESVIQMNIEFMGRLIN